MTYSVRAPRLASLALPLALSLGGCHHDAAEVPVDLGTPRQLLYVADDLTAQKHGGSAPRSQIRVYELDTLAPVAAFDGGNGVGEMHATPDGSILWIVASTEGTVTLFDTTTYESTELDVGVRPVHSFITPTHDRLFIGNDGSADVSVISLADRTVLGTILTGAGHHKMAMAGDATTFDSAYVSNITDGTITPVGADLVARANVVGVGAVPHGMDYSFVTKRVYNCSGNATNDVEVIATTDEVGTPENDRDTIVAHVALPSRCSFLHVSEDGMYALASLPGSAQLARIRLSDHHVDLFATGLGPDKLAEVGDIVYVANALEASVSAVDVTGAIATVTIPVGNAVAPATDEGHRNIRYHANRLYVPNAYDGTLTVIDTTTNTVVSTIADMHAPVSVAIAGPGFGTTYPR